MLNLKRILERLNKRRLSDADSQIFSNLGFVNLYQNGDANIVNRGLKYLKIFIKKEESKFILYPNSFNYRYQKNEEKEV